MTHKHYRMMGAGLAAFLALTIVACGKKADTPREPDPVFVPSIM